MSSAYGFIEITGVVAAMDALDIMCKAADVSLATWERKLGGRLVTLVVEGEVAAVREAVEAGRTQAIKKPAAWGILPNPHPEIRRIVAISASRFKDTGDKAPEPRMMGDEPPEFNLQDQQQRNS